MKTMFRAVTATLGIGILGAVFTSQASAGCSNLMDQNTAPSPSRQQQLWQGKARLIPATFLKVGERDRDFKSDAIVGMWKFTFVAKGNTGPNAPPDGVMIDAGYATWHSDGTEIMNSGRPPASGNFCTGVWKQTGPSTFKLNHYGLSWTPDGKTFVGSANIREVVTVDEDENNYQGTFTIDQYDVSGSVVLAHVAGTVKGTRITVN